MKCEEGGGVLTPVSLVKHGIYKCIKCGQVISKFARTKLQKSEGKANE